MSTPFPPGFTSHTTKATYNALYQAKILIRFRNLLWIENVVGTKEEELVLCKVSKHSSRNEILDGLYKPEENVKFEVKTVSSIEIGKAFQIELVYRNTTKIAVTVKAGIELMSTQYTGQVEKQLDSIKSEKCLEAMKGTYFSLFVLLVM